jgi:hypothetical protein
MKKGVTFKSQRVEAHNEWPAVTEFAAEVDFRAELAANSGRAPFQPIKLEHNDDPAYQTCIGHLIDGLDALPLRPDYFFDHCFRVLDNGTGYFGSKGIEGVMMKLPGDLIAADSATWTVVVNELVEAMPHITRLLLARRLLQSHAVKPALKPLIKRAERVFGSVFAAQFGQKYAYDASGAALPSINSNIDRAASLLKQYLSGEPGTRTKAPTHPALDLRGTVIPAKQRMQVLLSLLLFTLRNERAHGTVISPFRTSRATVERYESYYYIALMAYVFALGSISVRFSTASITSTQILTGMRANLALLSAFFHAGSTAATLSVPVLATKHQPITP